MTTTTEMPAWLAEFHATAPGHLRAEIDTVVGARLAYDQSMAAYDAAFVAGEDMCVDDFNGIPHPDDTCDALGHAVDALARVDPAAAGAYRAAEQAAEDAAEAAQTAARPAWLAEVHASAQAWVRERMPRYRALSQRVADADTADDWDAREAAEAELAPLEAELFGEDEED
jgi:hypothetical protein